MATLPSPGRTSIWGLEPSIDHLTVAAFRLDGESYEITGSLRTTKAPAPPHGFGFTFTGAGLNTVRCGAGCSNADYSPSLDRLSVRVEPTWSVHDGACGGDAASEDPCYVGDFTFVVAGSGSAFVASNGRTALVSIPETDVTEGVEVVVQLPLPADYQILSDPQPAVRAPWGTAWWLDETAEPRLVTAENAAQRGKDTAMTFLAGVLAATATSATLLAAERFAGLRRGRLGSRLMERR